MIYQRPSVTLSEWAGLAEFTNRLLIDHHFEKYVMRKIVQNYQFACGHGFQTNLNSKDSLALAILMGHLSKQTKNLQEMQRNVMQAMHECYRHSILGRNR